ncbi:Hsp20/alpha crystallin family protein [Phormidesmis priestleyi]|uniref:Hsp20/alpha crystallin family protein n=1 Tax=Phormidesmis priestleyi TaxID=268141 RepID=UPI001E453BEC|nr:Hsp20/alpha crystallin family protein [Phormidesmis priestleyi]
MMTLVNWQPWQEMEAMRRQFDRVFEDLATPKRTEPTWQPAVELKSTETEFVLRVQLPGINAKDLDVKIGRSGVALSGEHKAENTTDENGFFRSEFRYGKFQRVISLPSPVQNDQVKADFKDGVLTLTLPKVQAVRPSVVTLNLAELDEVAISEDTIAPAATPETGDVWTQS